MVTASNPYVDRFFYYDNNITALITELKAENYDYVIDLHNNIRSNKIRRELKKTSFTIDKLNVQKFLLTKLNINLMPGVHITQRSLNTVAALNVVDDGGGLDYFIPESDRVAVSDIPTSHSAGFVAVVIGANYYTKKLPVHKLRELCSKLEHPIILVGGKEDREVGAAVAALDDIKIYNACGKFNLNESADIIRKSKLVISHDTGMQYIACAFQKPLLAIWGGTSPKLDVEPYYGKRFLQSRTTQIYENILLDLRCQPCSKYGTHSCPLEHFNCMEKQDIGLIVNKAYEMLART